MIFDQSYWITAAYSFLVFSSLVAFVGAVFVYLVKREKHKKQNRRKR